MKYSKATLKQKYFPKTQTPFPKYIKYLLFSDPRLPPWGYFGYHYAIHSLILRNDMSKKMSGCGTIYKAIPLHYLKNSIPSSLSLYTDRNSVIAILTLL